MSEERDLVDTLLAHDEDVAVPADHERRIREGLGALLGPGPGGPSSPPEGAPPEGAPEGTPGAGRVAQSVLGNWGATGVVTLFALAGGFAAGRATAPSTVAPPPPVVTVFAPAPVDSIVHAPAASESAAPASPSAARPEGVASAPAHPSTDPFDREQSLLERARSALVRHDAAAAAAALDESEARFPRSRHAEERDYLRIQIARERQEGERVRTLARAFLARYPDSLLRGRVEPLTR